MFNLKSPCSRCPFRVGNGKLFMLSEDRLLEIFAAPAFQCHLTVEYGEDEDGEDTTEQGDTPQQCAGLMAVLSRDSAQNAIMQVAERLGCLDAKLLDPKCEAYPSRRAAMAAHARVPVWDISYFKH